MTNGRREVTVEVEVPGTPEDVWQAVATGPGYSAWFAPTEIEEAEGGAMRFDLGDGAIQEGTVTGWQPPHRLTYVERDWSGEAPPLATEVTVEARGGGTCLVRMMHSLATDRDDWDGELSSMREGWPTCFTILRLYLAGHAGQPSGSGRASVEIGGDTDAVWQRLQERLGLAALREGDAADLGGDVPATGGRLVERGHSGHHRSLTLATETPIPGALVLTVYAWQGRGHAMAGLFFWGEGAEEIARRQGAGWQEWLETFAGT